MSRMINAERKALLTPIDSNDELIWKGEHTYADNG